MKDKKSKEEIKQNPGQFYYESIGMILLILTIVIVAKLGKVGLFFTLILKVLFGDWYLLLVVLLMIFGIYLILNHKGFNFKNQRFLGYVFFVFSLLLLSHFSVHNFIKSEEGSYLKNTFSYYKMFITNDYDSYLGGGIIGAIMFFIIYSLLSSFGVILISTILIILGLTMVINKPLKELGEWFFCLFKKIGKYEKSFSNFFKYEIGAKKIDVENIYNCKRKITLKNLDEYKNLMLLNNQEKNLEEIKTLVISVLNNLNYRYRLLHCFSSYSSSLLVFQIYDEFDCSTIGSKISILIEENIYLSKVSSNLNIEINNKNSSVLSLRELLSKQSILYNNYLIAIGINIKNQIEEIDFSNNANILVIGDINAGVKSCVSSIVLSTIMKVTVDKVEFHLFDELGDFCDYNFLFKTINNGNIKEYLKNIIDIIDERVNMFNLKNIHHIDEYNILLSQESYNIIKRMIYVVELDDYNNNHDYKYIDDKIMYIIQVGMAVGVYIIFVSRNIKKVSTILFSLFKNKLVFNIGEIETPLIETKHCKVLTNKGDSIFYRETIIKRIQCPKFTKEELEKIKQEIK